MRRQEHRKVRSAPSWLATAVQEQCRRCGIAEAHRVVVDLLDLGRRAVGIANPAGQSGRQLLVEQDVVVPKEDIVRAERLTVGPF
jgi:hypothetical protein